MKTRNVKTLLLVAFVCLLGGVGKSQAQEVAIKTNLLHDVTLTPNLGVEIGMAPHWTFDLSADVNEWPIKYDGEKRYWKRWMVIPEFRYWFCQKFQGNFIGLHLIGGKYDVGNIGFIPNFLNNRFKELKDERWKGWGVGAGISYGHAWVLSTHWNIEAEIGIGWIYSRYDRYNAAKPDIKLQDDKVHNYVGPTRLAVNLEYVF